MTRGVGVSGQITLQQSLRILASVRQSPSNGDMSVGTQQGAGGD